MSKKFIPHLYDEEEKLAFAEFDKFAKKNNKIYTEYTPTRSGMHYDVNSINYTGGCECVELKLRKYGADKYGDCFIEPEKWKNLMKCWDEDDSMPIYVNFIGDYKNVYVWYLPELTGYTFHQHVKIKDEYEDRYGLAWEDARHYIWNDEIQNYTVTKPINVKILNKKARQMFN